MYFIYQSGSWLASGNQPSEVYFCALTRRQNFSIATFQPQSQEITFSLIVESNSALSIDNLIVLFRRNFPASWWLFKSKANNDALLPTLNHKIEIKKMCRWISTILSLLFTLNAQQNVYNSKLFEGSFSQKLVCMCASAFYIFCTFFELILLNSYLNRLSANNDANKVYFRFKTFAWALKLCACENYFSIKYQCPVNK